VFCKENQEVILTDRTVVLSREEADSSMLLNISHAAQDGHHHILILSVDTSNVILALFSINHIPCECKLCLAFGTGKSFSYLVTHQIAASLGQGMSYTLRMFHALTGCDAVSRFARHRKKTASKTQKSLAELTDALLMLVNGTNEIPNDALNIIKRFVILLFNKTSTCTKVNNARRKFFPRKNSVQQIRPIELPDTVLPSPIKWG